MTIDPQDFKPQSFEIELPTPTASGKVLRVRLREIGMLDLLAELEGIPTPDTPQGEGDPQLSPAELIARLSGNRDIFRRVARRVVVEPRFAFDGEQDGLPLWDDVRIENQAHIFNEAIRIAGMKGESAAQAPGFPAGAEGAGGTGT